MADLEELPLTFPAGIRQHEQEDAVIGGPPNLATGEGLDNVPLQQLAQRTRWLRNYVDELLAYFESGKLKGTVVPSGVNADRVDGYHANALAKLAEQNTFSSVQRFNGGAEVSGNPVWHDGRSDVVKNTSGWMRLPNDLILQWGQANTAGSGSSGYRVFFPITFPTKVWSVVPAESSFSSSADVHHSLQLFDVTEGSFRVIGRRHNTDNISDTQLNFIAVGH